MIKVLLAGLGGFIGSALRYVISTFFYKLLGTDFPYGTFVVNVLGSFLQIGGLL
jgi:CrcB protein